MSDLAQLDSRVWACQKCDICQSSEVRIFGAGDPNADVMLVGESPGNSEKAAGVPFAGDSGQLLDKAFAKLGVIRGQFYLTNILKCWPGKRKAEKYELAECIPFLEEQIQLIKPKVVLALGAASAQTLLEVHSSIGKIRGGVFAGPCEVLTVPTWHPSYIIHCGSSRGGSKSRQKKAAKEFIADLKVALDLAGMKWEEAN